MFTKALRAVSAAFSGARPGYEARGRFRLREAPTRPLLCESARGAHLGRPGAGTCTCLEGRGGVGTGGRGRETPDRSQRGFSGLVHLKQGGKSREKRSLLWKKTGHQIEGLGLLSLAVGDLAQGRGERGSGWFGDRRPFEIPEFPGRGGACLQREAGAGE